MTHIEDIDYLKKNSIKQSYNLLIDSKNRDRNIYPNPNHYAIDFTTPFRNVIGFEVIDASIPKGMYNIDTNNNTLYFYVAKDYSNITSNNYLKDKSIIDRGFYYKSEDEKLIIANLNYKSYYNDDGTFKCYPNTSNTIIDYTNDGYIKVVYNENDFLKFSLEPGEYVFYKNSYTENTDDFLQIFNNSMVIFENNNDLYFNHLKIYYSYITNKVWFESSSPVIFDMNKSSISEVLGFDTFINKNENNLYRCNDIYLNRTDDFFKCFYTSVNNNIYDVVYQQYVFSLYAPGSVYLLNNKYIILRCDEIEQHAYRSLSYSKYTTGIAKFRVNSLGYNDESVITSKLPLREFHPIGKLSRMTLRFMTYDNELYDFKGINHHLIIGLYYYEPLINLNKEFEYLLNPNYRPNFNDYNLENDENSDDEDNDEISRDNLLLYKKNESLYINNDD